MKFPQMPSAGNSTPTGEAALEYILFGVVLLGVGMLIEVFDSRGWRVYLLDDNGTSIEAMDRMFNMGLSRSDRESKIDAYAAMMVLERYFSMSGEGTELGLPKNLDLRERLGIGPPKDVDYFSEDDDED